MLRRRCVARARSRVTRATPPPPTSRDLCRASLGQRLSLHPLEIRLEPVSGVAEGVGQQHPEHCEDSHERRGRRPVPRPELLERRRRGHEAEQRADHLNADYWQRASFDAVVVIGSLLGLVATAPTLKQFRPRHWATATALVAVLAVFGVLLADSFRYAGHRLQPYLERVQGQPL